MMGVKTYYLWHDYNSIHVNLDAEPREGDIVAHENVEYVITGRMFDPDGRLHYLVKVPQGDDGLSSASARRHQIFFV